MLWDVSSEDETAEPVVFVKMKKCKRCNDTMPIDKFKSRIRNRGSGEKTYFESRCLPCFFEFEHERVTSDEYRKNHNEYSKQKSVLEKRKEYRRQDHVVEQEEHYRKSDAGKASMKRRKRKYYGSDKWRANQDEVNAERRRRYSESETIRINTQVSNTLVKMLIGKRRSSETVFKWTGFQDVDDLVEHLQALFKEGMTLENYGSVWHIEHRVAKCWYSKSEEDIRRCWSRRNVVPEFASDNWKKGITIIDSICHSVGSMHWPEGWLGVLPPPSQRPEMYAKVRNGG